MLAASKVNLKTRREFEKFRNQIIKKNKAKIFHNLYFIKAYHDLVEEGKMKEKPDLLNLIQKRKIRTMSGVAPVTVVTKPFPCPGRCVYCPTDVRMPKSYLPSQPAAQRAFRQQFNPYTQVFVRLKALMLTGHNISKVELRILGGTWSSYKKSYQTWFVKQCLLAMNEFHEQINSGAFDDIDKVTKRQVIKTSKGEDKINTVIVKPLAKGSLKISQVIKENERAKVRCIGVNIETRPDFINKHEVKRLRSLGVTKVEMGVQTTDDEIQKKTKRGHGLDSVRKATKLLKYAGFKIGYHMMPNLPGATPEFDKQMIKDLFDDFEYQPDYLKIYPCMVVPETELSDIYQKGGFKPYDDQTLFDVLYEEMKAVPYWCRVDRVARDIPADEIEAGSKKSNMRQLIERQMKKEGFTCKDIRAREIGELKYDLKDIKLIIRSYCASEGFEFFISYEDIRQDKLIGLIRLRINKKNSFLKELKNAAIIREVHVYGKQTPVGKSGTQTQHMGWGQKLMKAAEKIAKEHNYNKVAVIAGIGTREYYKKRGYNLEGTYMVKEI
jgi:elongator complex protein 3